nr:MAG TPA: minor capsid protein [Caudoviricetes sp.]
MLDPKYLERFSDQLLGIIDSLIIEIISDMAKRIVKMRRISDSTKHQAEILQNAGLVYEDTIKRVSQISGYQTREIERMYQEAGVRNLKNEAVYYKQAGKESIKLEQSNGMQRILQANVRKTCQELDNLTMTTAVKSQSAFIQACNRAQMKVSTGAFSYDKAIADAIKEAAVQGTEVLYPSQHVDKLDVAVRRAALTGVNQTAAELNLQYAKEAGCDYVETTAHAGARPTHAVWQGKVFCLSGMDPKYENFYEATGYGTGPGLCGWNCRHNFHAFFPGISESAYTNQILEGYNSKNVEYNGIRYTEYETAQMQRGHERKIRETKRKLAGYEAGMKETDDKILKETLKRDFEAEAVKLKKQEKTLKDFCHQTGRQYESARTQIHAVLDVKGNIVGFNRSVAQKAVWKNRKNVFKNQMSKQLEKLTDEEKKAIWRYTGNAANRVNSAIYSGKQQRIDREKGFMNLLDSALNKGTAEHKMVVHRDTIPEYLNVFPKGFQYSDRDIERLTGVELTNFGYTSTSFKDLTYTGRNVHLEIEIPKGYKGCLYIENLATDKYKNQEEVLFKRGFRYKIKSVKKEKERYYIKAEAVL